LILIVLLMKGIMFVNKDGNETKQEVGIVYDFCEAQSDKRFYGKLFTDKDYTIKNNLVELKDYVNYYPDDCPF
jgi:hypothetical protein